MKAPGLRDRWRAWRSADSRATVKYLNARPLDIDAMARALVDESPETQRIVLVKTELQSLAYTGSSTMSGVAVFVAALASAGTLLTALIVPLLSTSLTGVMTQYGLQGELPLDVSLFIDRMLGTATQPLAALAGVLVVAASLALFTALTRDREGAAATMRFTRYHDALAAAQESEPDTGRRWKSASELLRRLRHRA